MHSETCQSILQWVLNYCFGRKENVWERFGFLFALCYISCRELVWTVLPSLSALVQLKYFHVGRVTAPKALKAILILLRMNQNPQCLAFWD